MTLNPKSYIGGQVVFILGNKLWLRRIIHADDNNFYVEIPKTSAPYILRPIDAAIIESRLLSKMLEMLQELDYIE